LPEHYLKKNYESIVEYVQDVKNKGYIFGISSFHSTDDHLCFRFVRNQTYYFAVYTWETEELKISDSIEDLYPFGGIVASIQPEILPNASDSEFFYSIIEPYYINELKAEGKSSPEFLANTTEADNPIIVKFKFRE